MMKIYPNPARSEINIQMTDGRSRKIELKIYDTTGKLVKFFTLSSKPCALRLNPGIYFVKVDLEDKTFIHKVIVVK